MASKKINNFKASSIVQSVTIQATAIICFVLSMLTIVKLNLLAKNGVIPPQMKRDIPLLGLIRILKKNQKTLVYSLILNTEEILLAVCYFVNTNTLFSGGNILNLMYSWGIFVYLVLPSFLLFLTRYFLFIKERREYLKNIKS